MGCVQSSGTLPAEGVQARKPKHLNISTERPSLKVCVVTTPSGHHVSPKNSSLGELGIYDDDRDDAVTGDAGTGDTADHHSDAAASGTAHKSKYAFQSEADKTRKRPRLNFVGTEFDSDIMEGKAEEPDDHAEDIFSIDDIADTFVEVSTDDDSSDDDSDDGFTSGSNFASAQPFDETIEHMINTNGYDRAPSAHSVLLSSDGSNRSPVRKNSANSGSMSPDPHDSTSPLSPVRKGSGKWRTSSVLSPAVARVSRDIFPRDVSSTADSNINNRKRGLDRFRNVSGKIRLGVRLGLAVKKASDMHGMKRINQYLIIKMLGEGSYGKVKLVEDQNTGKQYALKILKKTVRKTSRRLSIHESKDTVVEEIAIMKKLNHPNVVRLHEVLETTNQVYLVLEYRRQGPVVDLEGEMKSQEMSGQWSSDDLNSPQCPKLALETVRTYTRDIVQGLSYLHAHGVIHQDLKPNNLLLGQDGSVAISDFGISTIIHSKSDLVRITNNGTPAFMAPELHGAQSSAHSGQVRRTGYGGFCCIVVSFWFAVLHPLLLLERTNHPPPPPPSLTHH